MKKNLITVLALLLTATLFVTNATAQEKITGPWLWMIAPTEPWLGGATSINIDSLAVASGGAVTEADIAANGARAGDLVGNYAWTFGEISATGGNNINECLNRIGMTNGNVDDHSSYALFQFQADTAQHGVTMRVGSDDAIKVWLNGAVVHNHPVNRGAGDFQDTFPVNVVAGENLLLVKVSERGGGWSMFVGMDFDPFKPIHLPGVPWLVSLIYFRPSDRPVRPNVNAEIDALIKEAQRFFADEMERHGFGRKTFQFEADANGNAVVRHVNGKFPYAHYQQNLSWDKEINEQVYIPGNRITAIMIDTVGEGTPPAGVCGHGGGSPYNGGGADIYCWEWSTIAHELGHAFGMGYHDFRSENYLMSYGYQNKLSPCFAAWLDVHPAFNPTVVRIGRATIQMLSATLAAPPNAIRLRFTVTAPAGSLYQARLWTPDQKTLNFVDGLLQPHLGGLIGCKRIDGNPTSSTVEFVTVFPPDTKSLNFRLHIIGIDGDVVGGWGESFSIFVSLADVNRDGVTDMADLAIVAQLVAQTMGEPVENPRADVNGDGVVDGEDFALVAANLGEGEAAAPSQAALPAGLTLEKVEWALNLLHAENTGSPAFRRGIAKLEGFLALLVPDKTLLLANYPNPFNPETWIPYQLSKPAEVTVTIYAANGAVVRMLDLGHRRAGSYESRSRAAYWDGRNAAGEPVASGVYFYTLSAGEFSATRKMVIRK